MLVAIFCDLFPVDSFAPLQHAVSTSDLCMPLPPVDGYNLKEALHYGSAALSDVPMPARLIATQYQIPQRLLAARAAACASLDPVVSSIASSTATFFIITVRTRVGALSALST